MTRRPSAQTSQLGRGPGFVEEHEAVRIEIELGGVLTATGLGTVVAEGKAVVMVGGHECIVGEALRAATLIVTEMAVIEPSSEGLIRRERAPGVSIDAIRRATAAELRMADDIPEMEL